VRINATLRRFHATIVAAEKQEVLHILDFAFVGLGIQNAKPMRLIILSFVACLALQYFFPHYLINGTSFGKKLLNMKCVF